MIRKHYRLLALLILGFGFSIPVTALGGGGVEVNSADPNVATQGTKNLNVRIGGKGFDNSASVRFLVSGTRKDTGGIVVNHVTFEDPENVTANIDVSDSATVADFDIEVSLSRGRGGKGTTLFKVQKGEENIVTLDITYEFGALTNDVCVAPDCVSTTITATGSVECGNYGWCDFNSTSVVDTFRLPSGLRNLLFATSWRGTDLDPDACFGSSPGSPGAGEGQIINNNVFLRRFDDEVTPWFASVGTWARDILDIEDRKHIFNFEGCGAESCGAFAPGSMEGVYEGGKLKRIDGPGNDRKFLSIPCRCTISNTPDCPVDVPVPTPEMRITVVDVTP